MNINLDQIVDQLSKQFSDGPLITILEDKFQTCFDKQKIDIESLIEAKKAGELTAEEFDEEIKREKQILEAELLTMQIATKSEIQKFVNTAFEFIGKSLL